MSGRDSNTFKKAGLFASPFVRQLQDGSGVVERKTASDMTGSNIRSTSSFKYDNPGSGLKSTQQLMTDWSQFENHTFFNSAEAKVNIAFDTIVNRYPFDGTKQEVESFTDELTGYEKYVYDNFPKHVGFLHFSGTQVNENPRWGDNPLLGTYIKINDYAGNLFPDLSTDKSGKSVIDPGLKSITFEMDLYVPSSSMATVNQVVAQKLNNASHGITLGLSGSSAIDPYSRLYMIASSGSDCLTTGMALKKGQWNHVCATFNRKSGPGRLELYNNSVLESTSDYFLFGDIDFRRSPLYVGSGSMHTSSSLGTKFVPLQTLSGAIDEMRIFHDVRTIGQQKAFARKNIFPTSNKDLKLYFKFNEPTGSYTSNDIVLDSSGNSLHSRIQNYTVGVNRVGTQFASSSVTSPLILERKEINPVLFPTFADTLALNVDLLNSASLYDANNPNLITRLIPRHYLLEAECFEGLSSEDGDVGDAFSNYDGQPMPGGGKIGAPQLISMLLYTWAKYFDELKMFVDYFGNLLHVDYDDDETIPPQLLPFLGNYYGFDLPNLFSNASIDQLTDGENLTADPSLSKHSLRFVQNEVWKRILINLNEITRSKGTIHAIKSFMRCVGINPDNNFRFREYGGSRSRDLSDARRNKVEMGAMLDLSSSLSASWGSTQSLTSRGIPSNKPFLQSPFLSASRVEPGYPPIAGALQRKNGLIIGTNERSDGLFTSGSWTYEATYKFSPIAGRYPHPITQSLARLHVSGAIFPTAQSVIVNVIAYNTGVFNQETPNTASIRMYARPAVGVTDLTSVQSPTLIFSLNDVNLFDGDKWYVSFGRQRNDEFGSVVSSSYFLRAGKQSDGQLTTYKSASILFESRRNYVSDDFLDAFESSTDNFNAFGPFITIGTQSLGTNAGYLNRRYDIPDARYTDFTGKVGQVRFWSEALSDVEAMSHAANFRSLGVENPTTNFNFEKTKSGSFERLRLDVSVKQEVTKSDGFGSISLFDYSQNNLAISGSGFIPSKRVIKPERFDFSMIDPRFDEGSAANKIRIRSWQKPENVELYGGHLGVVHELLASEQPNDDLRFSIDVSSVQALNEDIVNIFSTLDELNNVLGQPELLFATDYHGLETLRDIYFDRLTGKVNLRKFFEFFKWFDSSMGIFVEKLIPKHTKFLGVNFVIESHMLERAKFSYNYEDAYLGENVRHGLKGTILMRQLVGELKRF